MRGAVGRWKSGLFGRGAVDVVFEEAENENVRGGEDCGEAKWLSRKVILRGGGELRSLACGSGE